MPVKRLDTPRLRGEPLGAQHRAGLLALLGDPRVGATLGGVATAEKVDAQIAVAVAHWEAHGFGWFAFHDPTTGQLVARGGPQTAHVGGRDEVEIGWTVVPERWGQGLATELGAASLELAFGPLDLGDVVSFTRPDNHASRRVMEKLGFGYERDTEYKGWPQVLYRKRRDAGSTRGARSV